MSAQDEDPGSGGSAPGSEYQEEDYQEEDYLEDYIEDSPDSGTMSPTSPRFWPPPHGKCLIYSESAAAQHIASLARETQIGDPDVAELLLMHANWRVDRCTSLYFDSTDEAMFQAGLQAKPDPSPEVARPDRYDADLIKARLDDATAAVGRSVYCPSCQCNYDESEAFALCCNHWTCRDCTKGFLETWASMGSTIVLCPQSAVPGVKCTFRYVPSVFQKFCDPLNWARYRRGVLLDFMKYTKDKKYCPGADCNMICWSNQARSAYCTEGTGFGGCGARFCPNPDCNSDSDLKDTDHVPCTCENLTTWADKSKDGDVLFNFWLRENAQKCPKCKMICPKDRACNHVKCGGHSGEYPGGCGFHFCYLCLGDWQKIGGYSHPGCNIYEHPKSSKEFKTKSFDSVDPDDDAGRYMHYKHRYDAHKSSENFSDRDRNKFKERCHDTSYQFYQSTLLNSDKVDLGKAYDLVVRCRRALKYSYVYGYFTYREAPLSVAGALVSAAPSTQGGGPSLATEARKIYLVEPKVKQDLFEYQQGMLEGNTEKLSMLLLKLENKSSVTQDEMRDVNREMQTTETFLIKYTEALNINGSDV